MSSDQGEVDVDLMFDVEITIKARQAFSNSSTSKVIGSFNAASLSDIEAAEQVATILDDAAAQVRAGHDF